MMQRRSIMTLNAGLVVGAAGVCGLLVATLSVASAQQGWEAVTRAEGSPVQRFAPHYVGPAVKATVQAEPVKPQGGLQSKALPAPQIVTGGVEKEAKPAAETPTASARRTADPVPPDASAARQYCANIIDTAADARFALQKKMLADMEQEIGQRIALLEAKTAEYQHWLARRDEFSKKAQESLISIFSRMRAEPAAAQLAAMDEETASALLMKLDTRIASTILNEMPTAQAARLTAVISGASKVPKPKPEGQDKKL